MTITQEILFICFQVRRDLKLRYEFIDLSIHFKLNKIPFGIGVAGNIYIGQLLGANLPEKAKNATKVTFFISGT